MSVPLWVLSKPIEMDYLEAGIGVPAVKLRTE